MNYYNDGCKVVFFNFINPFIFIDLLAFSNNAELSLPPTVINPQK